MKKSASLDDLDLFARIAQAGGLAVVARQSGVSVPTLSRRMRALELQIGVHLFERGSHGYRLTAQGRAFLGETRAFQAEAQRLRRMVTTPLVAEVRITAGSWTSAFLAQQLPRFWQEDAQWRPAFLEADTRLDIARRGADIGIRNQRPEQAWLAGRCTGWIAYAIYAITDQVRGYVALPESHAKKRHPQDGYGRTMAARSRLHRVARACWLIWHVPEWGRWSCLGLRPPCFRCCSKLVQK